jgi:hypothetical protein
MTVTASGVNLVELTSGADGGLTGATTHTFLGTITTGDFMYLSFEAALGAVGTKKLTVTIGEGGTPLKDNLTATTVAGDYRSPKLLIGAQVKATVATAACNVYVDDVLFDDTAASLP